MISPVLPNCRMARRFHGCSKKSVGQPVVGNALSSSWAFINACAFGMELFSTVAVRGMVLYQKGRNRLNEEYKPQKYVNT
jgi:hypothetical protein